MIDFKNDDFLGKTVESTKLYCSIGILPLRSLSQLSFAAGNHKFSSLCGFIFQSANPAANLKQFMISFVCKPNPQNSMWYIFKKIDDSRIDVLDQRVLSISYGFDINRFFESDKFSNSLPKFKACIESGIENAKQTLEKLADQAKLRRGAVYINTIEQAVQVMLTSKKFNDKYYKLVNFEFKKPAQ